jgi:hypothetical protein
LPLKKGFVHEHEHDLGMVQIEGTVVSAIEDDDDDDDEGRGRFGRRSFAPPDILNAIAMLMLGAENKSTCEVNPEL